MIKVVNIVGARPNFMKIAPLMDAMSLSQVIEPVLVHTGQHYDEKMSKLFFDELGIPKPKVNLEVGSDTQAKQVAKIMEKFDDFCSVEKPDAILVAGDVNSTMACVLVASKLGIKTIHLEAGLRSYDRRMPEEINRVVTDALADLLLTPSYDGDDNLKKEGIAPEKIVRVGNIMIDTLYKFLPEARKSSILNQLGIKPKEYILITMHRPSNVDVPENLEALIEVFSELSHKAKVVFPVHPRTRSRIAEFGLSDLVEKSDNLILIDPLGYLDFQKLMSESKLVITDSGGVQEETTALGIPCITCRENTERPITVWEGTNELVGFDMKLLRDYSKKALDGGWKQGKVPDMWDGKASHRIVKALEERL